MTYRKAFNYDAADRYAREAGLVITEVTYAAMPAGVSPFGPNGERYDARCAYIGKPGAMPRDCAYGVSVQSTSQQVDPGFGETLLRIAEAIDTVETYKTRAAYEASLAPYCRPFPTARDLDEMAVAWRDYSNTAHRAQKVLPCDLLEKVMRLYRG